ncbi:GNS1/SUR4 membrane protein [Neocallimastix lanati (nom. inval.)]|jgi:fatty acid elongase 3|uniref:Elongation of fatty acids protein n=1 Tax=Neocallimastix californiae TaxID=1754190 RepID=A0A1Y2FBA7_9FUNG|nr:GNS1/SUR4 membrane protein [Neocallimastix sp. JGI-2020a]ORY81171.1 GNS1/SUR4 membrane protein [Neocallimastix californiae]|eukprot:ORY81171.1 GNS1/SUR4 membrane protein [Neocallimastix californiae]
MEGEYELKGYVYPYFAKALQLVTGKDPAKFKFVVGETPLSTFKEVAVLFCLYYLVIFLIHAFMKNRKPFQLKPIAFVHNCFLCLISLVLCVSIFEFIFQIIYKYGLISAVCAPQAYTQRLEVLYYCNYLVKYYEFIDTVFLALKKKKLDFLHLYHHGMTMFICWCQLYGHATITWGPVAINLFVHVIMYYYYARTTIIKKRVWWKQYLTTLQIVQFVIDIFLIYGATYTFFAFNYFPSLPNFGNCHGDPVMAVIGCAVITSYLYLFVDFFKKTYKGKKSSPKTAKAIKEAIASGKSTAVDAKKNAKKRVKSEKFN